MPTAVLESPTSVPLPPSMRKVWTQAECDAYAAADPAQWEHLELIEGQLINTMSKGSFHFVTLCLLRNWLTSAFGGLSVGQEPSIDVSPADNPTSEPEPDLIVTESEVTAYARRKPGPRDIRLLVEVADSSLRFDLSTKARLYARAEIVEYWVADVHNLRLHIRWECRVWCCANVNSARSITFHIQRNPIWTRINHRAGGGGTAKGETAELQLGRGGFGAFLDQVHGEGAHVRILLVFHHFEAVDDRADRADDIMAHARAQEGGKIERFKRELGHGGVPGRGGESGQAHENYACLKRGESDEGKRRRTCGRIHEQILTCTIPLPG